MSKAGAGHAGDRDHLGLRRLGTKTKVRTVALAVCVCKDSNSFKGLGSESKSPHGRQMTEIMTRTKLADKWRTH
jgi:hypothetical protein